MPLTIDHPDAERLAHELAAVTGENPTEAVIRSLKERLARERGRFHGAALMDELRRIGERCRLLPELDPRPAEEIIGYDENGIPR